MLYDIYNHKESSSILKSFIYSVFTFQKQLNWARDKFNSSPQEMDLKKHFKMSLKVSVIDEQNSENTIHLRPPIHLIDLSSVQTE